MTQALRGNDRPGDGGPLDSLAGVVYYLQEAGACLDDSECPKNNAKDRIEAALKIVKRMIG